MTTFWSKTWPKSLFAAMATLALPIAAMSKDAPPVRPIGQPAVDTGVHSYILLDRTGSMSDIWDEALSSVNAYAKSVGEEEAGEADIETIVNLAVFDAQEGLQFDVLRRGIEAETWKEVTNDEAHPRGMTPLFDAIGRIVALAEADAPEKAVLVIMTDGLENASREMTGEGAKAALDRARDRGWEVVFLGAEFANFSDAESVGVSSGQSIAVGSQQFGITMERLGKKSRYYAQEAEATIEFDDEDRAVAGEEEVKRKNGQR
ncbi:MAG: vWA domain-containing protein [Pseudomonadota bacterium]